MLKRNSEDVKEWTYAGQWPMKIAHNDLQSRGELFVFLNYST